MKPERIAELRALTQEYSMTIWMGEVTECLDEIERLRKQLAEVKAQNVDLHIELGATKQSLKQTYEALAEARRETFEKTREACAELFDCSIHKPNFICQRREPATRIRALMLADIGEE